MPSKHAKKPLEDGPGKKLEKYDFRNQWKDNYTFTLQLVSSDVTFNLQSKSYM